MKNSKFNRSDLRIFKNTILFLMLVACLSISCNGQEKKVFSKNQPPEPNFILPPLVGANQVDAYLWLLKNKQVGLVANQTSVIFKANKIPLSEKSKANTTTINQQTSSYTHLVDSLLGHQIQVTQVFAPEHGFRGTADAGELIKDGKDSKTGIPLISLYGKNKKPTPQQLKNVDILLFDIQDVGARFYTYISTLHYVMEACAEAGIPLLILDRPNPNIHYVDGPLLETEHISFVGMHPVPVVHGMTIAEYAQMINGQGWLKNKIQCELHIIPVKNYTRKTLYSLPIKPSPNLPNDQAINLYPSLCFFEGTPISEGRGTNWQFQVFGSPHLPKEQYPFTFTPLPNMGAKFPKFNGETCYGKDLRNFQALDAINLQWLIDAYIASGKQASFFTAFFTKLAGTKTLQQQIEQGLSFQQIKDSWNSQLESYNQMRKTYMLYPDE